MIWLPLNRQPFKGIYLSYAFVSLIVRFPWWTIRNLLPSWRPRAAWSLLRCLRVRYKIWQGQISRAVSAKVFGGRVPTHVALEEGDGFKGIWIDAAPELVVGKVKEWAGRAGVSPVRIPGYWVRKGGGLASVDDKILEGNKKLIYFLHGGGYVSLSGCPTDPTAAVPSGLLRSCANVDRAFSLEYRLSSAAPGPTKAPFPAALIDATAGYHYLINKLGYAGSDIIVCGDSAGGNLALALTRYIVDNPSLSLPVPGGLILSSPWTDLDLRPPSTQSSIVTNSNTDFLNPRWPGQDDYAVRAFTGPLWETEEYATNEYICPASRLLEDVSFKGFPKTIITAGGAELFQDQDRSLNERMRSQIGEENVTYFEAPHAIHDFLAITWHDPERGEAFDVISKWASSL